MRGVKVAVVVGFLPSWGYGHEHIACRGHSRVPPEAPRELKEETGLNAIKWRYFASRYHDAKEVLMLNYIVTADENDVTLNDELESVRWCTREEAPALIMKDSTAAYFLNAALPELGKKR